MGRTGIGMSRLIGLLLTLNLGVFLSGMALQYWSPAARAPLVFNAEKITLLAPPAVSASSRLVAIEKRVQTEVQPDLPAAPSETTVVEANSRCLSWASLDAAGLTVIEAHLKQAGIAANAYDLELESEAGSKLGWWVFLPPSENDAALQATIDEVRRLGVTDYAPVRGGSMRNALSLGAFAKLAQAREHAARLAKKGIKGVKFGPRPAAGTVRLVFSDQIADSALPKSAAGWPNGLQPLRCGSP